MPVPQRLRRPLGVRMPGAKLKTWSMQPRFLGALGATAHSLRQSSMSSLDVVKMQTQPSFASTPCDVLWTTCVLRLCREEAAHATAQTAASRGVLLPAPSAGNAPTPSDGDTYTATSSIRAGTAYASSQSSRGNTALRAEAESERASSVDGSPGRSDSATPRSDSPLTAPAGPPPVPSSDMMTRRDVASRPPLTWWVPHHALDLHRRGCRS